MIAAVPWVFAVGVALLMEAIDRSRSVRPRTDAFSSFYATWASDPGVIRVYVESADRDQARIVAECSEPPVAMPGEEGGLLVRVRILDFGEFGVQPHESAARTFSTALQPHRLVPHEGPTRTEMVEVVAGVGTVVSVPGPASYAELAGAASVAEASQVLLEVVRVGELTEFRFAPAQ